MNKFDIIFVCQGAARSTLPVASTLSLPECAASCSTFIHFSWDRRAGDASAPNFMLLADLKMPQITEEELKYASGGLWRLRSVLRQPLARLSRCHSHKNRACDLPWCFLVSLWTYDYKRGGSMFSLRSHMASKLGLSWIIHASDYRILESAVNLMITQA